MCDSQRNQDATCYVGNLDEQLSEELLWEMMLQAGPVASRGPSALDMILSRVWFLRMRGWTRVPYTDVDEPVVSTEAFLEGASSRECVARGSLATWRPDSDLVGVFFFSETAREPGRVQIAHVVRPPLTLCSHSIKKSSENAGCQCAHAPRQSHGIAPPGVQRTLMI